MFYYEKHSTVAQIIGDNVEKEIVRRKQMKSHDSKKKYEKHTERKMYTNDLQKNRRLSKEKQEYDYKGNKTMQIFNFTMKKKWRNYWMIRAHIENSELTQQ